MAKKPSAAELKSEGEALAAQFAEIRKKQHNFALLIAKDGLILETHKRHPGEVLWRRAKKAGGSNKGAKGICTMSGKVIEFQCDDLGSVPSTLAKLFKVYCKDRGQPVRCNLVEMTGEPETDEDEATAENENDAMENSSGGAEEEIQMSGGGGASGEGNNEEGGGATEADLVTSLQREYEELVPKIEASENSDNKGFAKKVGGLKTMFETQIEGNAKKARAVLGLLQTTIQAGLDAGDIIEEMIAGGADPAAVAERRKRIAELERGLDELLAQFAAG